MLDIKYFFITGPAYFVSTLCKNYTAVEGDEVTMEVQAAGIPSNFTFTWFYEGIPIDTFNW